MTGSSVRKSVCDGGAQEEGAAGEFAGSLMEAFLSMALF